jgi:hypothetical protein
MEIEYLNFLEEKILDLQKIKKIVVTFSYWFCFGNNFLNV